MAKAWIYQDDKQVKKHGEDKASWYVGWIDPAGKRKCKSCGPGEQGKRNAEKLQKKRAAELLTGSYNEQDKITWKEFRKEYEEKVLAGLAPKTRTCSTSSMDAFERHVKPVRVLGINTATIDEFVSKRRSDRGQKKGCTVSA